MATASKEEISDVFIEDIRSCWKVPAIAHFCSLFRSTFSLPDFEIEELEEALFLDAGVEQSDFIINLVVQLLCGIHGRKDIWSENYLKWLRCVMKKRWELGENRVNPLNSEDVTFKVLPTLTKVEILHALCDYRLDAADVSVLKDYDGDNLRVEPLGTDRSGATYWYFYGTRLYKEDREPTQEEREVKRKQKLKEKRKRRRERLKAVKKIKELRKKQKQKERGRKCKGKKKKKKVSKTSDEESNSESFNSKQQLDTLPNNRKKNLKKEPVRRTVSSQVKSGTTDKLPKVSKSKKQIETSTGVHQSKTKTNNKSSNETRRKESPQKSVNRKKKESSANIIKQKTQSKKRGLEVGKSNGKDVIKSKNKNPKERTSSSTKTGNKDGKEKSLQNTSTKTRKRKVIKSKAIISESDQSDEEDQPLKKIAKSKTSHKDIKVTLNQQKLNKKDSQSASKTDGHHKGNHTKGKSNNNKSEDSQQANTKKERKQRKLPMNVGTQEEVKQLSSEDEISSVLSTIESSDSDSEDDIESPRWHLVCHTQEDWQKLTDFFKKSKVKCEKELYKTLANDFLPEIQSLFAAKEKALRKKLQELEPRRASSRVVIMQLKREEDERLKSIEEVEQTSLKVKAEEEKREKMKLRNKHQEQSTNKRSCPDKPQTKKCNGKAKKTKKTPDSIDMRLQQVFDAVDAHEDSWPFSDPVDEAYAPAYYQIIIKPMCLTLIQKKLNKKEYKTKDEFERDMNQLFTNCLEYNGPGNEYTLMAENLKSCLEYNMEQVFVKQEMFDEVEDSEDETPVSEQYHRPPQRQSARNANTRLEKLEDKVYARLRGLSSSESSIFESNNSSEMMSDEEDGLHSDDKELMASNDEEEIVEEEPKEEAPDHQEPPDHQDIDSKGSSPLSISDHHSYDSNDNKAYEACSSKSEDCNSDNGRDVHTSDGESAQPSQLSTSILDKQKDRWASKPVGVIAFAPGVSVQNVLKPAENEVAENNQRPSSRAQESVHGHIQAPSINTTEVERKENPGQYLNTQLQGPSAISKVNRVKPIQNVSPYVPDTQSEKNKQILPPPSRDQYRRTQPMAQGLQPMIDLNLNRPDVLKPLTPSTNETPKHGDMSLHKQNTVAVNSGLNHVIPQGNLYRPSSLSQDSDDNHSKQFSYSGSSIKHKRNKPVNAPELPAPLTVLPDRHVSHESSMHVPAVQPLLPSSNYSMQATHPQQVANMKSDAFQQPGLTADDKANNAAESNVCHDPLQKLWHPLGSEDKMTSSTFEKTYQSSSHTITKSNQLYPHQMKLPPAGHSRHLHSPSGNILESLLHKQSHVSEYQHSGEITNHPKLPSTSAMYIENKKGDQGEQHFVSKHPMQPKLVTHANVEYHESHGQCRPHKQQTDYRSSQPFAYSTQNLTSHTNCTKTNMTLVNTHSQQGNVKLYHNPVNAVTTNPSQAIARQPDKSLREVAKQHKVTSPLYPHTSSMQSATVDQMGCDNVGSYLGKPRSAETVLPSRNNSLSMLSNEPRNMKEYMDLERANQAQSINELNKGYLPAGFNQGHTSSLYTNHLRMHASQAAAAAASYGYPAASHLILPSRQMTSDQSAFTPHDPYSRQSAFRMQRPSHSLYPQYMQEADQLARQQYQQHMHHRAVGLGAGGLYQTPRPTHTHPDMAFYTQRGMGNAVLGSQPSSGVGAPLPHDPSLLSRSSHMSGYK